MLLLVGPIPAQSPQQQKYVISIGAPSEKLADETLWLYSYSWYGLQQYKLAAIRDRIALVPADIDRLKRESDPHPNTSAYVVVIQAGEHLWFRTPDIEPDHFWTDLPGAIRLLGKGIELSTGETQLLLAAPVKRRVTLLYPDGRPKANLDLEVSIFLWNQNHCTIHEGLPLGKFRTDARGTIEVLAPLVPLHLDGIGYYESAGGGPLGETYTSNSGMMIPEEETAAVNVVWEIPRYAVQIRVLTPTGRPRPGVDVYGNWNTNTCGGADRMAETDSTGTVRLHLDATFTGLTLMNGGPYDAGDPAAEKNTRGLTDDEPLELFSKRKLTIRW